MDTKEITKDIAEAIVAQDTDGLDRSRYILERAVEYLRAIEPENATLRAWREKNDRNRCVSPSRHSAKLRHFPVLGGETT